MKPNTKLEETKSTDDKPTPPDRSLGGTFHYDKEGNFVRHDPPTSDQRKTHVAVN